MISTLEKVPGSDWFWCSETREDAPVRLVCFHGYGGSAKDFADWPSELDADSVECYNVELPGRGSRASDPELSDAVKVIHELADAFLSHMDKPFIFFGYSFGATLAFVLTQELEKRGLPLPRCLIVSDSPSILFKEEPTSTEFDERREKLPSGEISYPLAEADAKLLDKLLVLTARQENSTEKSISCPILAFGSEADSKKLQEWSSYTTGKMTLHSVDSKIKRDKNDRLIFEKVLLKQLNDVLKSDVQQSREQSVTLIEKWNSGTFSYPDSECLHDLFRKSAIRFPNETAVVYHGKKMSFSELDKVTDELANWLYDLGVREGSIVGIYMEHCTAYVIAFIAAHKAGGAYMPLEVAYPDDLLNRVLEEAKPVVVLTTSRYHFRIPSWQQQLELDYEDATWQSKASSFPDIPDEHKLSIPDSLAYVVMSSGTTGTPKGICCPHRGAVHSYYYRLVKYPYSEGDREACNVFFVWEMLRPLLGGLPDAGNVPVPLYVIPDDVIYNPSKLVEFLGKNSITRILFTPSLLQLILDTCTPAELKAGLCKMRIIWLCGEVVTVELRDKVISILPHVQLENLYSISECHDISYANLNTLNTRESPKFAPCGTVIPNVRALIFDDQMKQVPVGVPGRMYIEGPCLALGYLNMPEKTAERFLPNPNRPQSIMYDTGDRCRYLPSGSIEVIGRCDYMVKIRGYSVVIGAVEAAISEHPLVSTACVLTEGNEGSMDKKLVAYVVPERWEHVPTIQSIQSFVRNKLPPYAIPSVFLLLDAVPINMASGKLDRRKLPASHSKDARFMPALKKTLSFGSMGGAFTENLNDLVDVEGFSAMEKLVIKVWSRILNVDDSNIKRSSQFFDLGGHSLLLVKVASGLKSDTGLELSMQDLLENLTLESLSTLLENRSCSTFTAQNSSPEQLTDTEKILAKIWGLILQCDSDSILSESNFFDLGGHSLLLMKVASGIKIEFNVELELVDILECVSLSALSSLVSSRLNKEDTSPHAARHDDSVDLPAEVSKLDASIYPAPSRKATYSRYRMSVVTMPPARVFLTGVTGFVGAHILFHALMETKVRTMYCIVRARDEENAYSRIESSMKMLGLWNETIEACMGDRVVAMAGDLSNPLLGLSGTDFKALAGEIDAIIHAGAQVNLVLPYHSLKPANVLGTQEVLRLAVTNGFTTRVKPVHYISTNGIFPFGENATVKRREGDDIFRVWKNLKDGYAQTKWVSEMMCMEVRTRGLPVSILRCGNMSPSSNTGVWNGSDFIYLLLKACIEIGCVPNASTNWKVDMTPVDYAARSIVHCAIVDPAKALGRILHVQNPNPAVPFDQVVNWIEKSTGLSMRHVSLLEFRKIIFDAAADSTLMAQVAAGFDTFSQYFKDPGDFGGEMLFNTLEGTGISCPKVDVTLISKYAQKLSPDPIE